MYEKYNFDTDFQDKILACIVAHPKKFLGYGGILASAFFTGVQRIAAARAILGFWRERNNFPDWSIVGQVVYEAIAKTTEQKEEDSIAKYVNVLKTIDTSNADYVASQVLAFARERAIFLAFERGFEFFQRQEVPEGGYTKLFDDANKIGVNQMEESFLVTNQPEEIKRILDKLTHRDYGIRTGYPDLDNVWRNGWGPGWLITVLAPPKRYKTAFCVNLAMRMIGHPINQHVFYYPCEITQELAALRCLQNVAELEAQVLWEDRKSFEKKVNEKLAEHVRGGNGALMIKGYPSRTASIGLDIRSDVKIRCAEYGIKRPRAIFIDFAETVKPSTDNKSRSEHRAAGEIYIEARALAAEFECPVIMPDRCNKETVGRRVPNMKSFQGSFEKAGIVDAAIGLCADDKEYMEHRIRYFIFLNRHGHANQHFQGRVQPEFMRMTMDGRIPYDPDEDEDEEFKGHKRKPRKRPPIDEIQN